MYVVPGGYRRAIERGRLVVPAAEGGLDLFVDAVADRLHNFGFDNVPLRIDCHLDNHVAHQITRKLGAIHGRVWKHGWIRDVDFVAGDRSVNQGA